MVLKRHKISKKAQLDMAFIMYHDPYGILAAIFASMPLNLKQHCIRVGAVSGIIAEHAPDTAIPSGMTRIDYANAVRYGGFYHDLGAYLHYNQWQKYPQAGKQLLEKEISEKTVAPPVRLVILETVGYAGERCDGNGYPYHLPGGEIPFHAGICAVADSIDMIIGERNLLLGNAIESAKKYINEQSGTIFLPEVAKVAMQTDDYISTLYRSWKSSPPMWKYNDLKPVNCSYDRPIG